MRGAGKQNHRALIGFGRGRDFGGRVPSPDGRDAGVELSANVAADASLYTPSPLSSSSPATSTPCSEKPSPRDSAPLRRGPSLPLPPRAGSSRRTPSRHRRSRCVLVPDTPSSLCSLPVVYGRHADYTMCFQSFGKYPLIEHEYDAIVV